MCNRWKIPALNLSSVSASDVMNMIASKAIKIVIASIECVSDAAIQKAIRNLRVNYISIDECQVMDSENGWTSFRPYVPQTWNFLRANYRKPFLLCSATMEESSMKRIMESISIDRSKVKILYKSPDRPNIYQQLRVYEKPLDVNNIFRYLGFLLPLVVDSSFTKCQIFNVNKHLNDVVSAWLKMELNELDIPSVSGYVVEKLSGDNYKEEKLIVLDRFKLGDCKILVSTDVAGMGTDVSGLSPTVNVGIPKTAWKFLQQCGRAGREGQTSVAVTIKFPIKGRSAPEASLRSALSADNCLREALNSIFILDADVDYSVVTEERFECLEIGCDLGDNCNCESCACCSNCANECSCQFSVKDDDEVLKNLLQLGDEYYLKVLRQIQERSLDESDDEEDQESSEEDERVDELELSLVDLTPQFATLFSN